jgi:hypothetical protein
MTKKHKTTKTIKNIDPTDNCNFVHQSLLLPREMFKTSQTQLIVSMTMIGILLIQLYLFFTLNSMMAEFMRTGIVQ